MLAAARGGVTALPRLGGLHPLQGCDECGKEYVYKPTEVLRVEQEPPASFTPHPLFRDDGTDPNPRVADVPPKDARH